MKHDCAKGACRWCDNPRKTRKQIQRNYYEKHFLGNYEARRDKCLRERYGITYEQYCKMENDQKGLCAICLRSSKKRRLDVDHCHKTGKIRGLLCMICNRYIMGFIDKRKIDPQRILDYVNASKAA